MSRFNSINFYQKKTEIKLFLPKNTKFSSVGASWKRLSLSETFDNEIICIYIRAVFILRLSNFLSQTVSKEFNPDKDIKRKIFLKTNNVQRLFKTSEVLYLQYFTYKLVKIY